MAKRITRAEQAQRERVREGYIQSARIAARDAMLPLTVWETTDPMEPYRYKAAVLGEPKVAEGYKVVGPFVTVFAGRYLDLFDGS